MTHDPEAFQMCIDVFVNRYRALNVDFIAGLDARGFVLGPPIALALKKPLSSSTNKLVISVMGLPQLAITTLSSFAGVWA